MKFSLGDTVTATICGDSHEYDELVTGFINYATQLFDRIQETYVEKWMYKIHSTGQIVYEGAGLTRTRVVLIEKAIPELTTFERDFSSYIEHRAKFPETE